MEKMRSRKRKESSPEAPEPLAETGSATAVGGAVEVIWGAMSETLDLAEMSVGEVFRMLRAPFNIAPTVAALVNGSPVDADHRLGLGDVLEFARAAGEKGVGS